MKVLGLPLAKFPISGAAQVHAYNLTIIYYIALLFEDQGGGGSGLCIVPSGPAYRFNRMSARGQPAFSRPH